MDINELKKRIVESFPGSYVQEAAGDWFFLYNEDIYSPFATIVTSDTDFDSASNLNRQGFYRLNIGVEKETFKSLFGHIKANKGLGAYLESGLDFTEVNKLFPHPVYGNQYWISVINPDRETFNTVMPYLSEAYQKVVKKVDKKK